MAGGVLPMFVFLAVVLGLALRGMTPEERVRFGRTLLASLRFARDAVTKPPPGAEAFHEALRARTRWVIVTPALVAAQVVVLGLMILGSGELADPRTLVDWGASIGPRTTNGEWWRLAAAIFVHTSVLHAFASVAGLFQAGMLTERLVGRCAAAVMFVSAGLFAGLWNLSAHPVTVSAGAEGGVFGVYGLLLAALAWERLRRTADTVPLAVVKGLWPGVALFLAYHVVTEGVFSESMRAGLAVGFTGGIVMFAGRATSPQPPPRRVLATLGASIVIVALVAVPLRGLADVTVEVARVIEIEERTAAAYDREVTRFRRGRVTAEILAGLAERISAELQSASQSLARLDKVPDEHRAMLEGASEYLRHRQESWRLRSEGLTAGRMKTLQQADVAERTALAALRRATVGTAQ